MKKLCLVLVLFCATVVFAQQPKAASSGSSNPVSDTVRGMLGDRAKNLTAAAEEMPADKYSYKPTEQQMTFATLMEHTINSNHLLCSKLTSQAPPANAGEKDAKEKLVAGLKSSFEYCQTALKDVQDSQLGEEVSLFGGRKGPKAAALIYLSGGWADHYGMAATYLRLNGLTPPTAKKAQTAKE